MQFSSAGGNNSDLNWLNQPGPERSSDSGKSGSDKNPNRNRRLGIIIAVGALMIVCGGVFGYAIYRAQSILNPSKEITTTVTAGSPATCQELIDRAMQASGDYCNQIGSNQVCYGNNTLTAELNPGGATQFAQRGDVVGVEQLKRLAASPLSLASREWGIAVFKVMANLPRSLPGETITMIVFGNTTLDNPSNNLQTFYFSSSLGQIQCDQVPFDGLMITMPDGAGVSFVINGAEMTLMGNASIKATKNGAMEVNMYSGSAYISANGESQFVTAGQGTSMDLGGPGGTSAVSPPSAPQPLSPAELALACTMTGHFCTQQEITPVSPGDAVSTLLAQLGVTPNPTVTAIVLPTSSPSITPSMTITLSKTITPSPTRTPTRTLTRTSTRTRTSTPTRTGTLVTGTATHTRTPTRTHTPTASRTSTGTPTSTQISTATSTSTNTTTSISTSTSSVTATDTVTPLPPTATDTPTSTPDLITLCHCTAADSCVEITVPNGSGGHWTHPLDIIPAPGGGCPMPSPTPTP